MRHRYENWVGGLNGDWLISRQRFFGVPFPLWYRLDEFGEPQYDAPLTPTEAQLPVDPSSDVPEGYTEEQRGLPGGFVGDPDVMASTPSSGRWSGQSVGPQDPSAELSEGCRGSARTSPRTASSRPRSTPSTAGSPAWPGCSARWTSSTSSCTSST